MHLEIKKSSLRPGEKRVFEIEKEEVLVIYLGGDKFIAVSNKCPHLGCRLDKTGVVIREELVCQCHFTHFSLESGEPRKGATKRSLKVYKVHDLGETIQVDVE